MAVPGVTRSFHFSAAGSSSAVTFGSHGSTRSADGQIRDVRRVVLVGEAGDVMPELVHEDVRRPDAVGRDGAVEAVDAAAAVGRAVGQDLDDVVRRVRGDVAERLVLEREHVALGVERVVGRADRRPAVDVLRRPRDARLRRRGRQPPDVDVALAFLERRRREQRRGQPLRVALELRRARARCSRRRGSADRACCAGSPLSCSLISGPASALRAADHELVGGIDLRASRRRERRCARRAS